MADMKLIAGHPCLDFVNTVGGRVTGPAAVLRDKLADYGTLARWSHAAGLSNDQEVRRLKRAARLNPQRAARTLVRAVRLREALYRIFESQLRGGRPRAADVTVLRREISAARAHQQLRVSGFGFIWALDDSRDTLDTPLWRISHSSAELLTSANVARLRQCAGDECGWLFLDTSRNRKRRWGDMKDCGNRAKVRRFRERHP